MSAPGATRPPAFRQAPAVPLPQRVQAPHAIVLVVTAEAGSDGPLSPVDAHLQDTAHVRCPLTRVRADNAAHQLVRLLHQAGFDVCAGVYPLAAARPLATAIRSSPALTFIAADATPADAPPQENLRVTV